MEVRKKEKKTRMYDPVLCTAVILAMTVGFLAIWSATRSLGSARYLLVQGTAAVLGAAFIFITMKFDYETFGRLAPFIFAFNVILLLVVLFFGTGDEVGTRGWIRIGSLSLQPAELVKVGFIVAFARQISAADDVNNPKTLAFLLLHAGLTVGLILLQPDYGTAFVFVVMAFLMLLMAGLKIKYVLYALGACAVAAPAAWFFVLKDYQKKRFFAFLNPEADPLGSGYHVMQSKIAAGSGKLFGSGLFKGVQTQLGYLPEKQTDFVFSVISEEMGFAGAAAVVIILLVIIVKCFNIAKNSRDMFGELICVGAGAMFLFHTFENIGMCIGLAPVTGIPLPFISCGGSNMLASLMVVGLVLNVRARSKTVPKISEKE